MGAPFFEPLQRERQVGAALRGRDRVDLVDDHPADVAQRVAGARCQHQVQRLGRGDQQIGGCAEQLPAVPCRRVTGAHADGRLVELDAETARLPLDAHERCPEVAVDIDRERLEGRDVQDAAAGVRRRNRIREHTVEGP